MTDTHIRPLTPEELADAPAEIRHMAVKYRRKTITTISTHPRGYQVEISSNRNDCKITMVLSRRRKRWGYEDLTFTRGGVTEDISGGIAEMLRLLSQSEDVDTVGTPPASTRHRGRNPTLVTRAHTIIRN